VLARWGAIIISNIFKEVALECFLLLHPAADLGKWLAHNEKRLRVDVDKEALDRGVWLNPEKPDSIYYFSMMADDDGTKRSKMRPASEGHRGS
jgi:hypothetical protein